MRDILLGAAISFATLDHGGGGTLPPAGLGGSLRPVVPTLPADDPEIALVTRLKAGDEAAYRELVRSHGGRLLAVAVRILRNREDARDAVQDAFISAFRALHGFTGEARLSTWLHRIVVNASLMKLRSRRRTPEDPIEDLLPRFHEDGHRVDPGEAWEARSDDEIEREERRAIVRAAIDRLPDSYRTVLLLRDIEELDTRESAQLLGISENAVKIRLHRARQALATLLEPHFAKGAA